MERIVVHLPGRSDRLEITVGLLTLHRNQDNYAYERGDTWHVGLGAYASLRVDPMATTAIIDRQGKKEIRPINGDLTDLAREFTVEYSKSDGSVFGQVGFNYGAQVRGQKYTPGKWPMMSLMVPVTEITLSPGTIVVRAYNYRHMLEVCDFIKNTITCSVGNPEPISTKQNEEEYKGLVAKVLEEIGQEKYTKLIPSRIVKIERRVDMPATLLHGRRANTPKRSYSLNQCGFQATGFSPELVIAVEKRHVITEPLAGTCVRTRTQDDNSVLATKMLADPKEIVEHIISVKEAIKELDLLCPAVTVGVHDLMIIKERGPVQHLGSSVGGTLSPSKDPWAAFNVIFPSITASGIPKRIALEAIDRLENTPRELYAGAVLFLQGQDLFEATLCLRTVFQDPQKQWIQAGAGVISASTPERELTETHEKMASIAPFIVYEDEGYSDLK